MATASLSTFLRDLSQSMAAEALGVQSDGELVEHFLATQSEAVFLAMVRRHGSMVYRVCWRVLRQEQDAEDAFQATFLVLAQKLQSVRKRASLASWLHGVAHRVALKAKAQAALRRRQEKLVPAAKSEAADSVSSGEIWSVLDAELAGLPDKWRMPLVLCYLEGRTQDEAAGQLGWSKNTLRRRLEEARPILGQRLGRRGVALPAALSALLLSDSLVAAALPASVVLSTAACATRVAGGEAVASVASGKVVALISGWTATAKIKLGFLLLAGLFGSMLALSAQSATLAETPPVQEKTAAAIPARERMQESKVDKTADALRGRWLMTLRAGFERDVNIRPLGDNRFSVENAARFSGVYELRQGRLVLAKPADPAELGFEWESRAAGAWTLVAQPPPEKIGQDYLGTTLKRLAAEDQQAKTPSTRLTKTNFNDQPYSFTIKVKNFMDKRKGEYVRFDVTVKAKDGKFRLSPRRSAELRVCNGEEVVLSQARQAVEQYGEVTYMILVAAKHTAQSKFALDEILGDNDNQRGGRHYWFFLKDFVEPGLR